MKKLDYTYAKKRKSEGRFVGGKKYNGFCKKDSVNR